MGILRQDLQGRPATSEPAPSRGPREARTIGGSLADRAVASLRLLYPSFPLLSPLLSASCFPSSPPTPRLCQPSCALLEAIPVLRLVARTRPGFFPTFSLISRPSVQHRIPPRPDSIASAEWSRRRVTPLQCRPCRSQTTTRSRTPRRSPRPRRPSRTPSPNAGRGPTGPAWRIASPVPRSSSRATTPRSRSRRRSSRRTMPAP